MKKVLILAYDFPPYVSVAGLRPKAWFDDLYKHGIYPIVVTRQWNNKHSGPLDYIEASDTDKTVVEVHENGTILKTSYHPNLSNRLLLKYGSNKFIFVRKAITAFYEITQYLWPIGPKAELYKAAKHYLKTNKVEVIVATGEPFVLFSYANKLSQEYDIPWIADYRDIWSELHQNNNFLLKRFHQAQEKQLVKHARAITTVSDFVKESIFRSTKNLNIHILPNGFDARNMQIANVIEQKSDVLRIGLAGSILPWNPLVPFLQSLKKYQEKFPNKKIEFHFIGLNNESEFEALLKTNFKQIKSSIFFHPRMENLELLKKMSEFNALLLFNNFSYMGTKIYDYLGLKRQIISCFSDDKDGNALKNKYFPIRVNSKESEQLQEDLILKTKAGIVAKDQNHFLQILNDLQDEFTTSGRIQCSSVDVEIYSRQIQVKCFAELLLETE